MAAQNVVVPDVGQMVLASINNSIYTAANFIPRFIAGLVILLIGIIIGSIVKRIALEIFKALKIEVLLRKYGIPEVRDEFNWTNILAEIIRWFVIILFLIPTADIWGLPQIITILNAFLLYLPNVFVAAIIAVVGLVFARLARDVTYASTNRLQYKTSRTISSIVQWVITIFILLAILNQLGVAVDLIRILITGVIAMFAIAGGIAFGLGGQGTAREFLEDIKKKLK